MSELVSKIRMQFLSRGVLGARDLAEALKVSQPTVSRALCSMGASLVRIGRGPMTRYGLASPIGDRGHSWPLYLIDPLGAPREIGVLHSLAGPAWWLESTSGLSWQSLTGSEFWIPFFPASLGFSTIYAPKAFWGERSPESMEPCLAWETIP
jgi:hypothetical protein